MTIEHGLLTGASLHQPFHFIQENDPGAVGAGLFWLRKSTKTISYRNDANAAWVAIGNPPTDPRRIFLPTGSKIADVQTALNDCPDGGEVILPNENINFSSVTLEMPLRRVTLCGSGPLSMLTAITNVSNQYGSRCIGVQSYNTLRNFTIRHDRAAMGPTGRSTTLVAGGGMHDIDIHHMTFLDLTSTALNISGPVYHYNINFSFNIAIEFWEQFLEIYQLSKNITSCFNFVYASNSNPAIPATEPVGFFIGNEQAPFGDFEDITIAYNRVYFADMPFGDQVNSLCCTLSDGGGGAWRYNRIAIVGNHFRGAAGIRVQNMTGGSVHGNSVVIINNDVGMGVTQPVRIDFASADYVELSANTLRLHTGVSTTGWNTPDPAVLFHQVNNNVVGQSGTLTATTVINDGAYNAFPGFEQLPDGKLLAAYVQSVSHTTGPFVFKYKISSDAGATWGTAATGPGVAAWVSVLANREVVVTEFDTGVGVRIYKGTYDAGTITWGSAITVYNGFTSFTATASPVIQLFNSYLIQPVYGKNTGDTNTKAGIVISTDDGVTWGSFIPVTTNAAVAYNEAHAIQRDSTRIVMIIRNETLPGYSESHSNDNGLTWSAPIDVITLATGHAPGAPTLIKLDCHDVATLFLLARGAGANSTLGRTVYATSVDYGLTWTALTNFGTDVPFVYAGGKLLNSGRLGTIIARENSGTNAYCVYQEFSEDGDLTI